MIRFTIIVLMALAAASAYGQADEPIDALAGHDPVELIAGKEIEGSALLTATNGKYRYQFANEVNRATFQKNPDRYSIQFGGACMRMSPVAGGGHPDRYFVHDQKIYIFASPGCCTTFAANPEQYIDLPDAPPTGTPAQAERAKKLLDQAVEAIGGAERLKSLRTFETQMQVVHKQGNGNDMKFARTTLISFPRTFVFEDNYGADGHGGWRLEPDAGFLTWNDRSDAADSSVRAYMTRHMYRHPVAILKAWQDGKLLAFATEKARVGETDVDVVAVGIEGATTELSIDTQSGRILQCAFRGRSDGGGRIGSIAIMYDDFRNVDGMIVPFTQTTSFDGEPQTNVDVTTESIRINQPVNPKLIGK